MLVGAEGAEGAEGADGAEGAVLKVLRVLRRRWLRLSAATLAVGTVGLVALRWWPISDSLLRDAESSTLVVDRHGTVLYEALSTTGARARRLEASSLPPF